MTLLSNGKEHGVYNMKKILVAVGNMEDKTFECCADISDLENYTEEEQVNMLGRYKEGIKRSMDKHGIEKPITIQVDFEERKVSIL